MTHAITHHLSDDLIEAYVTGTLGHGFSIAVASHLSLCPACRKKQAAMAAVGGLALEDQVREAPVPAGLKSKVMADLDAADAQPIFVSRGPYPAPVMAALEGRKLRHNGKARGIRQQVIYRDDASTARLLYIPPGKAVPDHGHHGLEMTLVLQGSFSDASGHFGVGDVEVADATVEHTPVAGPSETCICLAVTDAKLRFDSLAARVLQPLLGI